MLGIAGSSLSTPRTFKGAVKDLLPGPRITVGWEVEPRAVADTVEMQRAVNEMLNYDDAAYVVYSRGNLKVSIYLAYWTPGKMPTRLVASHTPDICWVMVGWKRQEATSGRMLSLSNGMTTLPAEERRMESNGRSEWVLFWHLFAGTTNSYETSALPPWYAPIRDLRRYGINQRREQFFLRISANLPVDEWWNEPIVQHVANELLAAKTGGRSILTP